MDKYNLNQHNRSHNGLFMSELIYVHGISPIPNVLQDNFHIFFRFLELRKTCNVKRKIAVVIADDWGALWAPPVICNDILGF